MTPLTPGGDWQRIVIVSGSRKWAWRKVIEKLLGRLEPTLVVHGACRSGADYIAEQWAKEWEVPYHGIPAKWQKGDSIDRSAGMKRNRVMIEAYPGQLLLAFPHPTLGSPGTRNCIGVAEEHGHPVWVFDEKGELIHRTGPRGLWHG